MKTVIGLFDDMAQAKQAALDLEVAGIPHNDISLVANNEGGRYASVNDTAPSETTTTGGAITQDAIVGAEIGGVAGLLLGLTGLAIPGLGWIAGAGWLMGMLLGAGTGAVIGGLVGALTSVGVPEEEAAHYMEGVRRGGILVAVKSQNADAQNVATILSDAGAVNVDERATQYQQEVSSMPPTMATTDTLSQPVAARRMAVETEPIPGSEHTSRTRNYDAFASDFRSDYQRKYANQGRAFELYEPSYRYGYELNNNPAYRGRDWTSIEPEIRRDWESREPNTWEEFKNSIRYAWDKATGAGRDGIQTGGRAMDGTPDTRGITEKVADTVTGDRIDDKTGKSVW